MEQVAAEANPPEVLVVVEIIQADATVSI